jgi:hypothetical protein
MNFFSKIKEVMNDPTSGWKFKSTKYQTLEENTDDEQQSSPFLEKGAGPQHFEARRSSKLFTVLPWLLTIVFVCTSVFQYAEKKGGIPKHEDFGSFDLGYASDFCEYSFLPVLLPLIPPQIQ